MMQIEAWKYIPEDDTEFHIDIFEKKENGNQIAEIVRQEDKVKITLYNNPESSAREIDLHQFIQVLQKAYKELF